MVTDRMSKGSTESRSMKNQPWQREGEREREREGERERS
jgi:hypothetical protein